MVQFNVIPAAKIVKGIACQELSFYFFFLVFFTPLSPFFPMWPEVMQHSGKQGKHLILQ
jgi:hypothetical protein